LSQERLSKPEKNLTDIISLMAERLSENSAVSVCAAMLLLEKIATRSIAASQERKSSDQAIRCQQEKKYFPILDRQKRKNKSRASRLRNAQKENDE
jgi:hypothetical protein